MYQTMKAGEGGGGVVSIHNKVRHGFLFGSEVGCGPGKVIPDPTGRKVPNWTAVRIKHCSFTLYVYAQMLLRIQRCGLEKCNTPVCRLTVNKGYLFFPSPAGMSLIKPFLAGKIYNLF